MPISTKSSGSLQYRYSDLIRVPNCFTTRFGGVSTGYLSSMNIGTHRGDSLENVFENYRILGTSLGFDPTKAVLSTQKHTDVVMRVTEKHWGAGLYTDALPTCDALITDVPETALVVFTADCTPVILWDSKTGAVGAVHAGWRGTAIDIAGKTVRAMEEAFGTDPADIYAAIGPNIASCCFETDQDVPDALTKTYGTACEAFIRKSGNKFFPDLKQINALSLRRTGVTRIDISNECTVCNPDMYWSHRVVGSLRGSQGAIIVCK